MTTGAEMCRKWTTLLTSTVVTKRPTYGISERWIRKYGSQLAESGKLEDASTDADWLARANGLFLARQHNARALKVPKTLGDAIAVNGKIHPHAEVYVFGKWLLLDSAPGSSNHPGKKPDYRTVIETLACAIYVTEGLGGRIGKDGLPAKADPAKPTTTKLARAASRIFGIDAKASDFSSRKTALRRILEDYLKYLKTATYDVTGKGKIATKSPRLAKVLKALTTKHKVTAATKASHTAPAAPATASSTGPSAASPAPAISPSSSTLPAPAIRHAVRAMPGMQIPLIYPHAARKAEYRSIKHAMLPDTALDYTSHNPEPHSAATVLRSHRADTLILKPALDVAANFAVKAVIDRLAITLSVTQPTNWIFLHSLLRAAGLNGWIKDRALRVKRDVNDFDFHLDDLPPASPIGTHFAILIQEPSPEKVEAFLRRIDLKRQIVDAVVPILLETSIDFFVKDTSKPAEMIKLREQMVGIIHRHIWCKPKHFKDSSGAFDAKNDERQVYAAASTKTKTRFLVADSNTALRASSYAWKANKTVRKKVQKQPSKGIFLNSTVYHGSRTLGLQISLQHKIADNRNTTKGTKRYLADEKRRARVELEMHGVERLTEIGIKTVADLTEVNFRRMVSRFFSFKIPVMKNTDTNVQEFIDIFGFRGCCGTALAESVKEFEDRAEQNKKRKPGDPVLRASEKEAPGLAPWKDMRSLSGLALDRLSKDWKKFSWP